MFINSLIFISDPTIPGFLNIFPMAKANGLVCPGKNGIINPEKSVNPLTDDT